MTLVAPNPGKVRSLPPPAPHAVSSTGPVSWAPPLPPPTIAAGIELPPPVAVAAASTSSAPITVLLRPVTAPLEVAASQGTGPVPDDVLLAVQRAIAAIGSEDSTAMRSPSEPCEPTGESSDQRRSALRRLINGLRRR